MSVRSCSFASAVVGLVAAVGVAGDKASAGGVHPWFKDQGALTWFEKLPDAQAAAKAGDKLIFIAYGQSTAPALRTLCEDVITNPKIKERLGKLCVGLSTDHDHPEAAVLVFLRKNLDIPKDTGFALPFVGFATADLQWVSGWTGRKKVEEFETFLAAAEKCPALDAKPDAARKLDGLAAQADAAVEKEKWKDVFAAAKAASDVRGRCPARERLVESVRKARAFAADELGKAVDAAKAGGDRTALKASLAKLAGAFVGEPESKDAESGGKAVAKLVAIEALPAEQQAAARTKAAKEFDGTRWSALFAADAK